MIWVLLVAVMAALAAAPMIAESRRKPLADADRRDAPGQIAHLSRGKTYFRWQGPADGQVAVCIHGLTTPSYVFDGIVPELVHSGHRVLTYDLFGRGLSDRPAGTQDRGFFLGQLNELLDTQDVAGDLVLVGYSMGGSIAAKFAAANPSRVDRLILIASAGLKPPGPSDPSVRPIIGDWRAKVLGGIEHRAMLKRLGETSPAVPDMAARQAEETRRQGFLPAVLSSRRHMLAEDLFDDHKAISDTLIATLAFWGEKDQVIPAASIGRLAQANRKVHQVTIPGAGHGVPYTHPDAVNAAIREFLKDV